MLFCYLLTARANEGEDHHVSPAVSSTTAPRSRVLELIQLETMQLLQRHIDNGTVIDIPLPMYASVLADTFYDQQQSRSVSGAVALTDIMLSELSQFVHRNVELRSRRSSL